MNDSTGLEAGGDRQRRWLRRIAIALVVLIFSYPGSYLVLRATGVATARVAYLNGFDESGNWETTSVLVVEVGGKPVNADGTPTLLTRIFAPCAMIEEVLIARE